MPNTDTSGTPGGSLVPRISDGSLLKRENWGFVLRWNRLGQKLTWLVRGTDDQTPRPVDLAPAVAQVRKLVTADGLKHFKRRERQELSR